MKIEHAFIALVFSVNGSMGPEAKLFHKNLVSKISEKTGGEATTVEGSKRRRFLAMHS